MIACRRLLPGRASNDPKLLNLIARTLSTRIPIYQRDAESGDLRQLAKAEIAAGRFSRGAMQLEFGHGQAPIGLLFVSEPQLQRLLETRDTGFVEAVRTSLTLPQAR